MYRDLVGRSRLLPGERYAVRRGLWRWSLRVASERREHPVGIALRGGPQLRSRWYAVGHGRLHARVSAPEAASWAPVVLVHGAIVSSRYLLPAAVELAAEFPVVVPDLPGYGLSARAREALNLATLADAVMECAGAAGYEQVSLVGHSFGAQIVVEAALRHPQRVERMVLLAPAVDPEARDLLRQAARWLANAPDEHPSVLPVITRDLVDVGVVYARRLLRVMLNDAIEDKLPEVRCPTLVVRGGRDRLVPAAWACRVARLLPRGELAVVPGYAHMAPFSGPLAVVPLLRPFLSAGRQLERRPGTRARRRAPGSSAPGWGRRPNRLS